MSNVNTRVPAAQGRSSQGLRGIWWHFNGLFIPEMPDSTAREMENKTRTARRNPERIAAGDEAQGEREEEECGALCASHRGSFQEHINIWIRAIWLSHPWQKYVMNRMRSANKAERQTRAGNKTLAVERRNVSNGLSKTIKEKLVVNILNHWSPFTNPS